MKLNMYKTSALAKTGMALAFAAVISLPVFGQNKQDDEVRKIKIVKVVNGEKTVIEKEVPPGVDIHEFMKSEGLDIPEMPDADKVFIHSDEELKGDGKEVKMRIEVNVDEEQMDGDAPRTVTKRVVVKDGEVIVDEEFEGAPGEMMFIDENGNVTRMEGAGDDEIIWNDENGNKKVIRIHKEMDEEVGPEGEMRHEVIIRKSGEGDGEHIIVKTETVSIVISDLSGSDEDKAMKAVGSAESAESLTLDDLKFYPNPNDGKFTLEFQAPKSRKSTDVSIVDMNGKEVFSDSWKDKAGFYSREIDLSAFPKGMYFLSISQGDAMTVKKIAVQ